MPRESRLRRTAPDFRDPSPGWTFGPPDFVGVGAQRSGTSWWHRLVLDHPQVVGPRTRIAGTEKPAGKELHYFDRFERRPFSDADADTYTRFFPRPPGSISGEWTPRYMHDFWTPQLLALAAPRAKLLVVLRDPVDRYASAVTRRRTRRGATAPTLGPGLSSEALARGHYHEQLLRLLRHFERSQVLVLQYERCSATPREELRRTYEFLGLEHADHIPAELAAGKDQAEWSMRRELREELIRRLSPDAELLARDFPEIDLTLWRHFAHLASPAASEASREGAALTGRPD